MFRIFTLIFVQRPINPRSLGSAWFSTMEIGVIEGMVHPVQMGKRTRMSFARIEEALAVPDLIEVQKDS